MVSNMPQISKVAGGKKPYIIKEITETDDSGNVQSVWYGIWENGAFSSQMRYLRRGE